MKLENIEEVADLYRQLKHLESFYSKILEYKRFSIKITAYEGLANKSVDSFDIQLTTSEFLVLLELKIEFVKTHLKLLDVNF